jgi:hypothetical protein
VRQYRVCVRNEEPAHPANCTGSNRGKTGSCCKMTPYASSSLRACEAYTLTLRRRRFHLASPGCLMSGQIPHLEAPPAKEFLASTTSFQKKLKPQSTRSHRKRTSLPHLFVAVPSWRRVLRAGKWLCSFPQEISGCRNNVLIVSFLHQTRAHPPLHARAQ